EYLAFKSEDVKEYQEALAAKIFLDLEPLPSLGTAKNITDEKTESKDPKATEEAEEEEIFYAVGYVEAYQDDENDGIYYKITAGGRPVCYVQGVNEMLGRFKNLRVSVEGKVNKNLRSKYAYPVIIVSKIRLML
ncbi:MAG TPA: hypothetical protein PKV41_01505, partial [Candidatus Omnitrophota bacterium]|nr:hypothetical protein [Candidatus Omnitrophota bacterium]